MTEILNLVFTSDTITIALAFVVFVITNIIKKVLPSSTKLKTVIIPFMLGVILYSVFGLIFLEQTNPLNLLKKGVEVGGVATLIFALYTQALNNGGIEKTLTKILKGVLTNSPTKNIVADIIDGYSEDKTHEENANIILMLLATNTSMSEEECKTITEIIMKAFLNK